MSPLRSIGSPARRSLESDEAFERLYAEHAQPLLSFLTFRTGNRAVAEDLLADAFERVLRARRRFDRRRASEKTWLYSIALNLVRDHARRQEVEHRATERVRTEARTQPASANPGVEAVEARDALQRALGALTPEEREAVSLRFGAELTVPEIAKVTGRPLTTVEGRVYRALRKLRLELERPKRQSGTASLARIRDR
jgi:RNA polymerase sigma factor (sigma-70 family)